uniref:Uncharacterized protein n=1 Tax=Arundo donax TaxID=35708 RepID=A0A0A9G5Y5_ARUDO
MISTCAPS